MKAAVSEQTKKLDKDIAAACRRQLGRNFVALICEGSRSDGDALSDSDYDGTCYVRDARCPTPDFSDLQQRYGIRIGTMIRSVGGLNACIRSDSALANCPNLETLIRWKIGRGRHVAGTNLIRRLPPVSKMLKLHDWKRSAQLDYWLAVMADSPSNVFRREPRRHVGFIIAICNSLLLAKGVAVRKSELPGALKRYHPKFRVLKLLRSALKRRASWSRYEGNRQQIRMMHRDLDQFLKALRGYAFVGDGTDLSQVGAKKWLMELLSQRKFR